MSSSQQMPGLDLPCLAFHNSDDRSTTLISMMSDHKLIVAAAGDEVLTDKIICPTAKGLLLVRDPDSMTTFLWNPMNNGKFQLPPLREVDDIVLVDSHCLLSDELAAPGCLVLLVEASENTFIWYCHIGDDDQWNKYEYDIGSHVLPYADEEEDQIEKNIICPIAPCHGRFFFNAAATELQVLDFSSHGRHEPMITAIAIDNTVTADGSYGYDEKHAMIFLVESDGELYMVRLIFVYSDEVEYEIGEISVHVMDFLKRQWRNVHDLGGRAFLLSRFYFGASCSAADHGLLPDRVYFVCDRNNTLKVFDVKEGTFELHKLDEAPVVDKAFWLLLPSNPKGTFFKEVFV